MAFKWLELFQEGDAESGGCSSRALRGPLVCDGTVLSLTRNAALPSLPEEDLHLGK